MSLESPEPLTKEVDPDVRPLLQRLFPSVGKLATKAGNFRFENGRCRCCGLDFHPVNVAHDGVDVTLD